VGKEDTSISSGSLLDAPKLIWVEIVIVYAVALEAMADDLFNGFT